MADDGTWGSSEQYWIQNFKGFTEPRYSSHGCSVHDIVPIEKETAKLLVEYKNKENDAYAEYKYTCSRLCSKQLSNIKTREEEAYKEYKWILNNAIEKHKSINK